MAAPFRAPISARDGSEFLIGAGSDPEAQSWIKGFRQRLYEFGWEDGGNLKIDLRWGGADIDFIRTSAAEFVSAKPDVSPGLFGPCPERDLSGDQPISGCLIATSDPVGWGTLKAFPGPAGNLTGFMLYEVPVAGKLVSAEGD